jgi:AAA+ superfamily predicted ATPase
MNKDKSKAKPTYWLKFNYSYIHCHPMGTSPLHPSQLQLESIDEEPGFFNLYSHDYFTGFTLVY